MAKYLPYTEPSLVQVLTISSFLYLVNVSRVAFEMALGAGLLGEIAVGIVFGSPLANILDEVWQKTFLSLGYVGLLLIVFEGGMETPLAMLLDCLPLALITAATGIVAPIGLSFGLFSSQPFKYSYLQSFSSGAALCSTSLGTTFIVLRAAARKPGGDIQLEKTRVGTVLAGAAVIDDVIGFVLSSIVKSLGHKSDSVTESPSHLGWSIAQPLVTSVAFVIAAALVTKYLFLSCYRKYLRRFIFKFSLRTSDLDLTIKRISLFLLLLILYGCVTIASVIGSSSLLGAYCAGLIVGALPSPGYPEDPPTVELQHPFKDAYEVYISPIQSFILSPLFFASVGSAVPFLSLWKGSIIWKGLLYTLLMTLSKVICGLWLLVWSWFEARKQSSATASTPASSYLSTAQLGLPTLESARASSISYTPAQLTEIAVRPRAPPTSPVLPTTPLLHTTTTSTIYPALFVGFAMVARGEVGLLIAQIGYVEAEILSDEAFYVSLFAIVLCTVIGPVAVSVLIRRVGSEKVASGSWR